MQRAINGFLPNGTIINGVCYIVYTPTVSVPKPQTRPVGDSVVGGAALVTGDRWYDPASGIETFYNGLSWLDVNPIFRQGLANTPITATNSLLDASILIPPLTIYTGIFIETWSLLFTCGASTFTDGVTDWLFDVGIRGINPASGANIAILASGFKLSSRFSSVVNSATNTLEVTVNTPVPKAENTVNHPAVFRFGVVSVGTPTALTPARFGVRMRGYI